MRLWPFAVSLSKARTTYNFKLLAWVAMPDHIHLILIPDLPHWPVSKVLWGLKRGSATRIKQTMLGATADPKGSRAQPIWQPGGGYDRNIRDPLASCLCARMILPLRSPLELSN